MHNNVTLKEYFINVKHETKALSQTWVGLVGFCHQINLLKFIRNIHRQNLTLKTEEKSGKVIEEGKFCSHVFQQYPNK